MTATPLLSAAGASLDGQRGLSSEEAARRFARFGPNSLLTTPSRSVTREVLGAFANPLMLVLLVSSGVAAGVGELVDATIIVVMVLLSVALNVVQSTRSRRAAERLGQSVAPTATVMRDGSWHELARRELVPGDVVRLGAGDLVPADGTLIDSRDLHVQEAALTGESFPAEKESVPDGVADTGSHNRVFLGTSVVTGTGVAVITATGCLTSYGEIAARLRERAPATEFDRGLAKLSALIGRTVVFLVLFLMVTSIALRRDPLESLLFAVALAVGLVPEFMPMITSVTLANGAVRMARAKVIVRHLAAIQNLGSIDVLCSDKTGTLTLGEMTLEQAIDLDGEAQPDVLSLALLNSRFETGIRSPLDVAILRAGTVSTEECEKLDEIPFDFERRRASIVVRRGNDRLLVSKGAPESVAACCNRYAAGAETHPLDDARRDVLRERVHALGTRGLRVLGVAWKPV
ncbi:MAG TPA: HAD-IC family P-type ATPase, partial [Gemmatimonadaceae bacterium]